MTEQRRRIDQIEDPTFLSDLDSIPIDELRGRRVMCDQLDVELSYYRRMIHGRMDLLAFEMRRRAGEEPGTLIDALPRILAEGAYTPQPGLPVRSVPIEVPDLPTPGRRLVDRALHDDFLTRLSSLGDDELRDTHEFLAAVEADVSHQRKVVYTALDVIQAELIRRYREGLADPGELLTRG